MRTCVATLAIIVLTLACAGMAMAGSVPTPTDPPEGVTIITPEEVKSLVESKKAQIFDMRKALNFGKGHLPGATCVPYKWTKKGHPSQRTGEFDMTKLPSDKNTPLIFHSDGPTGWKSYYASKAAVEAGYKNVSWMRQGFAGWQDKGYPVEQ